MTDRFNPGKIGDWAVYCDICGRKCFASETVKLDVYTGRGGLIVCKYDADRLDPGLIPYKTHKEKNVLWTRINHSDTTNGAPLVDLESMSLSYFLTSSQDNIQLTPSQNIDEWFVVTEPI